MCIRDRLWFFYLYLMGGWIRELMEGAEDAGALASALARDGGDGAAADRDAAWAKTAGASGALAWLDPARLTLRVGGGPMAVAGVLVSWAAIAAICCAQAWFGFDRVNAQYPVWQYMIPTFLASTGMLVAFARLAMAPSRTVNNLAKCALGVYLIHDNPFVRAWLWPHFAAVYALGPAAIIGASLLAAVGVYAFGAAVDSLRIALLEKPLFRWLNSRFGDQIARADHWFATMGK